MPDGIACVCFYDAERVLSTIAKFLVYLLGEGEGRGDICDIVEVGEESGEGWKLERTKI